jgi:lambda family phage tail tape measure protein
MAMNMDAILNFKTNVDGANKIVELNRGLKTMEGAAKGVTGAMRGMTGAAAGLSGAMGALTPLLSAAGLVGLAKGALDAGDRMYDLSKQTGVSVESLAKFKKAAATSGTDIDSVAKAMGKLSKNMLDAATGSKQAAAPFKALGISVTDSKGQLKTADAVLLQIADRFKAMGNDPAKPGLAMKLLGRAGAEMIPLLDMGGQAIDKLSVKMTTAFAEKADAYKDKLAMLSGKVGALGADLLIMLLPALDKITDAVTGAITAFNNLPEPVKNFAVAGAAVAIAWGPATSLIRGAIGIFALFSTSATAAGAAAAGAAPRVAALKAAMGGLLRFGLVTLAIDVVINGMSKLVELQARLGKITNRSTKDYFSDLGGQSASREKLTSELANVRMQQDDFKKEIRSVRFPLLTGQDEAAKAGLLVADTREAMLLSQIPKARLASQIPATGGGFSPDLDALRSGSSSKPAKGATDKTEDGRKKLEVDAARIALQAQYVKDERQINDLKRIGNSFQANGNTLKVFEVQKSEAILEAKLAEKKLTDETVIKLKESANDKDKANRKQRDTNILGEAAVKMAEEEEKLRSKLLDIDQQITQERKKQAQAQEKALGDIRNRTKYAVIGATQGSQQEQRQREIDDYKNRIKEANGRGDTDEAKRLQEQLDALIDQFKQMDALANNAAFGFAKGIRGYLDGIGSLADSIAGVTKNVIQGLEDKLVEFVTTGKINFREFANEIIKQLIRIAIQQAILKPLLQGIGGLFGFGGGGGGAGIAGGQSIFAAANGMVAANGIRAFSMGGVVTSPTLFKFANGGSLQNGLMGEAGPEGILPLRRGADGKLGVIASGGGGSTTINVSVDAKGSSVQGDGGKGNQLARVIAAAVQEEMMKQKRPGGILA